MNEKIYSPIELASLLLNRVREYHLEWEVLWCTFATLIQKHGVKSEDIMDSILEGLNEWDV